MPRRKKRKIETVKEQNEMGLLEREGVSGVGIGQNAEGHEVLQIYLSKDSPKVRKGMPDEIEGFPVELLVSGDLVAQDE
jgi:hypothetical protein